MSLVSPFQKFSKWLRFGIQSDGPSLSILTCVYHKSPANFFLSLHQSIVRQNYKSLEWVVLVQGDISKELQDAIEYVVAGDRVSVKLISHPENMGIFRGLRLCLENASSEFVMVVDGDDLLANKIVPALGGFIEFNSQWDLVFTDEDQIQDQKRFAPYYRPGWDPVLNLCSSYIWHLIVFRKSTALELGVFSNNKSEWAQDWDTICRFAAANKKIGHFSKIGYHWRSHENSTTNTAEPDKRSLVSQQEILETYLKHRNLFDVLEVVEFPINRGAVEFWIRPRRLMENEFLIKEIPESGFSLFDVKTWIQEIERPFILFRHFHVIPVREEYLLEAQSLFALHPEMAMVGGPLADKNRKIMAGDEIFTERGTIESPLDEVSLADPGPYAYRLKAHLTDSIHSYFFAIRTKVLKSVLLELSSEADFAELGTKCSLFALKNSLTVGFSPLLAGQTDISKLKIRSALKPPSEEIMKLLSARPYDRYNFHKKYGIDL